MLKKTLISFLVCLIVGANSVSAILAQSQLFGVHLLSPEEVGAAAELLKNEFNQKQWNFITLPLPMSDLNEEGRARWQGAFDKARELHLAPIVRLVSEFDPQANAWRVPTRADIMSAFDFLSGLNWPTEKKFVIVYNEPNHLSEWGGKLDPAGYAQILKFAAAWAHSENFDYRVLPAAMDLAAPNGNTTMEAFAYLEGMLAAEPEVFAKIDYWNSHSYPNPAFSAAASATGKQTLHGFKHELEWLKEKTGLERRVFITETGWEMGSKTTQKLREYYQYALKNIWSDDRVVAVTPFVLQGEPGPFAKFTLLDKDGEPTPHYEAIQQVCLASSEANAIDVVGF